MYRFEWDPAKAVVNERKHGVAFREAATIFSDPLSITIIDSRRVSPQEERLVTTGTSDSRRLLVVVHVDIKDTIRIISARKANRRERRTYAEGE